VGQLERWWDPGGVRRLAEMAAQGALSVIYDQDGVVIYAVPGRLARAGDSYVPQAALPRPDVGSRDGQGAAPAASMGVGPVQVVGEFKLGTQIEADR